MDKNKNINNKINDSIKIYTKENIRELNKIPELNDGQVYIYVIENYPQKNIKIGKTTNIQNRIISLSGSNGGGSKIKKVYCSPATWIEGIEKTCHIHYDWNRISGTEWFKDLEFDEVVEFVDNLFRTDSYARVNELRRKVKEKIE